MEHGIFYSKFICNLLNLINEFSKEARSNFNFKVLYCREQEKIYIKNRLIIIDPKYQTKEYIDIGIREITKKVPQWTYNEEIRTRKSKRVVIFTNNQTNKTDEIIRYSQQSDYRRDIIKGSMRAQRRKTLICKLFQLNVHSPLFVEKYNIFFYTLELIKLMTIKWAGKKKKIENLDYKKIEEKARIEIAEAWDSIFIAQVIRGLLLVTQSVIRKYIKLPFFIIVKNISYLLLFQRTEWSEDLKNWSREIHVKCTYNGIPLSEREFPKNWLTDGIQIKILFPFGIKTWHKHHRIKNKNDFCFLTVFGMETELPFGSPIKKISLFELIFKELNKKSYLVIMFLKEKIFNNIKKKNYHTI